jgi:hypothetical protein
MKTLRFPRMPVGATRINPGRTPSLSAVVEVTSLPAQAAQGRVSFEPTSGTPVQSSSIQAVSSCGDRIPCCFLILR